MAHVIEAGPGNARNVELTVVPFIDLMSCLTAFLLVTAVWVHTAQLPADPRPAGERSDDIICYSTHLSVLIERDAIWLGLSRVSELERIAHLPDGRPDWTRFEQALAHHKASAWFVDRSDLELAAESSDRDPVRYQSVIAAMDIAIKVGFTDVSLTSPEGLRTRPGGPH